MEGTKPPFPWLSLIAGGLAVVMSLHFVSEGFWRGVIPMVWWRWFFSDTSRTDLLQSQGERACHGSRKAPPKRLQQLVSRGGEPYTYGPGRPLPRRR